jgi:hypothetical protein
VDELLLTAFQSGGARGGISQAMGLDADYLERYSNSVLQILFVFGPNAEWDASPPTPASWMHQLGGPETGTCWMVQSFGKQLPSSYRKR